MGWERVDRDYVLTDGIFVFRLHYCKTGVYNAGRAFRMEVRRKDESVFRPLGYAFWVQPDGGYDTWKEESVESKLWKDGEKMLKKATEILQKLGFEIPVHLV